jgi:hypothetical protein
MPDHSKKMRLPVPIPIYSKGKLSILDTHVPILILFESIASSDVERAF